MNSQNLILIGIGLFLSLIIAVVAIDQYLLAEHNPMDPDGLLWRVRTAFDRVDDLEAVIEVIQSGEEDRTVRMRVWYVKEPTLTLRVLYLEPADLRGEIFTISRDLLSHHIPRENLTVIRRWVGFPLASLGLAIFDLAQLERDWTAGRVELRVIQNIPQFDMTLFPDAFLLAETFTGQPQLPRFSLATGSWKEEHFAVSLFGMRHDPAISAIPGGFILKVYDGETGLLTRMIWIDGETFLVTQVVIFVDGKRVTSIRASSIEINKGLNAEELIILPRGSEVLRG